MPPDRSSFKALNTPQESVPQWMGSFDLSAAPNTDLWRKPPCRDTSTAPILYTSLRHRFTSAEVTVSADLEFEWDQAGLVIFAGAPPGREERPGGVETVIVPSIPATERDVSSLVSAISIDSDSPSPLSTSGTPPPRTPDSMNSATLQIDQLVDHVQAPPPYPHAVPASKWIKLSLELSSNAPHATAVVATPDGADWSATTLPGQGRFENGPAFPDSTRPAMSATPARLGDALWLWYQPLPAPAGPRPGEWVKLREVTWFFFGVEDKVIRVGVYASRPAS
ncbi:hypothetical protein P152DRAFT_375901, partial [Eremomyces bilateralis CBS 781.70]